MNAKLERALSELDKENFHRFLGRHLAALTWVDSKIESHDSTRIRDPRPQTKTGFLVYTKGHVLWVSAGHCIEDLAHAGDRGRKIENVRLFHGWHLPEGAEPVSLHYFNESPKYWYYNREYGWDIGAIPVDIHARRLLQTWGTIPIRRSQWATKKDEFDFYYLLGFPIESRKIDRQLVSANKARFKWELGCPGIFVEPTSSPPGFMSTPYERVYGKIMSLSGEYLGNEVQLSDIDGMSGGPLIGVKINMRDGEVELECKLVGVQSSWDSKSLTIAACPIKEAIGKIVNEFEQLATADN